MRYKHKNLVILNLEIRNTLLIISYFKIKTLVTYLLSVLTCANILVIGTITRTFKLAIFSKPLDHVHKTILYDIDTVNIEPGSSRTNSTWINRAIKYHVSIPWQYDKLFIYSPYIVADIEQKLRYDRYLHKHYRYYVREMRVLAYTQLLQSYQSLTLDYMAKAFGVTEAFIDQ